MNPQIKTASALLVSLLLAACGSNSAPSPGATAAAHRAAEASLPTNASAEEVAAHMRGDVSCPAPVKTPPPAAGAAVDDIRGVRPGLTYEEAANVIMCTNPLLVVTPTNDRGYQINTFGQKLRQGFTVNLAEPRVQKSGKQIMDEMRKDFMDREMNAVRPDLKPGQQKWFVSTMGMPGQERVIGAAYKEMFAKGKNPTVDSIVAALEKKYGNPTRTIDDQRSGILWSRMIRWAFDPRGRLITETSPLYGCSGISNPDDGINLSADCGIVVQAQIVTLHNDNAALVDTLSVGTVDQANGYALLTSTEQQLKAGDAARRAKEVQQAAKNVPATSL